MATCAKAKGGSVIYNLIEYRNHPIHTNRQVVHTSHTHSGEDSHTTDPVLIILAPFELAIRNPSNIHTTCPGTQKLLGASLGEIKQLTNIAWIVLETPPLVVWYHATTVKHLRGVRSEDAHQR